MSDESYTVPKTEIDALLAAANIHGMGQGRESVGSPPGVPIRDSARELLRARDALERRIGSITSLAHLRETCLAGAQRTIDEMRAQIGLLRETLSEHELNSGGVMGLTEALERAGYTELQLAGQRQTIASLQKQVDLSRGTIEVLRGQRDATQELLNKSETALASVTREYWDRTGAPPRSVAAQDE